ncbi:hypothetical protein BJ508DRAFT_305431 [Ascobolus immersus RN42]|uniref:Uncharacterized protein n=1 Tax=Ascobolus immersus RN42 TaxID=1160509 RepID=A0A3N4IAS7_ASCIM|nr:hypothetical protein BJ508DRAFT_305431 [Ascobolus immersus RN42]
MYLLRFGCHPIASTLILAVLLAGTNAYPTLQRQVPTLNHTSIQSKLKVLLPSKLLIGIPSVSYPSPSNPQYTDHEDYKDPGIVDGEEHDDPHEDEDPEDDNDDHEDHQEDEGEHQDEDEEGEKEATKPTPYKPISPIREPCSEWWRLCDRPKPITPYPLFTDGQPSPPPVKIKLKHPSGIRDAIGWVMISKNSTLVENMDGEKGAVIVEVPRDDTNLRAGLVKKD